MATRGGDGDTEVDAVLDTPSYVPNETKHYDVALLFAENDKDKALGILEEMEQITLDNGEKPKVCLYTDLTGAAAHTEAGRNLTQVATLIFVLATENLQDEEVAKLIKDESIGNTRLASKCHPGLKYCVRPLYLEKERKAHPPSGLSTIQEVRWYDKDSKSGKREIRMLLQNHMHYRKQREREDSRQRRAAGDANCSGPPKDFANNINIAASIQPAHQEMQVPERDIPPERRHLDSSAAVRLSPIRHREREAMATSAPDVGQQSVDSINLQRRTNTNESSSQSRSTDASSDVRASGQSASERNNYQPPSDSAMAQRNNKTDHFMNPAQRTDLPRDYPSQDEASNILDGSPTMDSPEINCSEDADSGRNDELQTSGSREEQGSGHETDEDSIVESDLAQTSLTTDALNTGGLNRDSQQTYTRNASSAGNVVSTNPTGSLMEATEHGTMTEKAWKYTGQAHRPAARCAAPNDLGIGEGEKGPHGAAEPKVVHYHTHYHGEVQGVLQGGSQQRRLPGGRDNVTRRNPGLNVVGCGNVQIGTNLQVIGRMIPGSSNDVQNDAPTTISPEDPPPPYSVDDPSHGGHDVPPEPVSGESEETTPKQVFISDDVLQDGPVSEKMKPENAESNSQWSQENEPVTTDGGSCTSSPGDTDSGFVDPRVQSPSTATSDENPPSGTSRGRRTDLSSMESLLGSGDDLLQMVPDSEDEEEGVIDASGTGEIQRTIDNENLATPPVNTVIIPPDVFRDRDLRRTFVYIAAGKGLLK